MQRRFYQAILTEISVILQMDGTRPFYQNEILCCIEDIEYYLSYLEDNTLKTTCHSVVRNIRHEAMHACQFQKIHSSLSYLHDTLIQNVTPAILIDCIIQRKTHWMVCRELIDALRQLDGVIVRIIPIPLLLEADDHMGQAMQNAIAKDGYDFIDYTNYDIETDMPDMALDNFPLDRGKPLEYKFLRIHNCVSKTIHLEHAFFLDSRVADDEMYFCISRVACWNYLAPSPVFENNYSLAFRIDNNVIAIGYPEIDLLYKLAHKSNKHFDKPIVLWNVTLFDTLVSRQHGLELIDLELSYLESAAKAFPQIDNIVRLHPAILNGSTTQTILSKINYLLEQYQNISLDPSTSIIEAYQLCTAFVSWMGSSTTSAFPITEKPMLVLPTFSKIYDTQQDLYFLSNLDIAYSYEDIAVFYTSLENPQSRHNMTEKLVVYYGPMDGTICQHIGKSLLAAYDSDNKNRGCA